MARTRIMSTMSEAFLRELHRGLPDREGRLEYTRRAFGMLPEMDMPRILDVGCGRGDPTLELARLSRGHVTGVDIDQGSLDELSRMAAEEGLDERGRAIRMDMNELKFPDGSFDLVWAEGSIWVIGLERGLHEWRRLLVPDGFIVFQEACWLKPDPPKEMEERWEFTGTGIRTVEENLELIARCGYSVLGHFRLPDDAWWDIYFGPLDERIRVIRLRCSGDPALHGVLEKEQELVDLYRRYSGWYGSAFFVLQTKTGR